jgi:nucleoside-diphosphate-sugar epimerase
LNTLVIGGSGHVSGAVVRAARRRGDRVWTVTRGKRPLPEGVTPLVADRHDAAAMESVLAGETVSWDLVVDCIGFEPADILQDVRLFRERAAHFVFVSTDFVYDPARRPFPQPEEAEHWVGAGKGSLDYGFKKRLCEQELAAGDAGGMKWTVVRPCHIYGPTSELGCLPLHGRDPQLIDRLREGRPLQLAGGGYFLQQPVLADDLAETIVGVAGHPRVHRAVFNVAGPDVIESWQYYRIVADALGVGLAVDEVPVRPYLAEHPEMAPFMCHRVYDRCRLRDSGLPVPSTPVAEGLRRHVEGLLARRQEGERRA